MKRRGGKTRAFTLLALALPMLLAGAAPPRPSARGLCRPDEPVVFSCPIGRRTASICGSGSRAVYRFGRPSRVEAEVSGGRHARQAFSGGGEMQIAFERNDIRYVVYDQLVRTSFGADGPHDPEQSSGVLVLSGDTQLADRKCNHSWEYTIDGDLAVTLPEGPFTEHAD